MEPLLRLIGPTPSPTTPRTPPLRQQADTEGRTGVARPNAGAPPAACHRGCAQCILRVDGSCSPWKGPYGGHQPAGCGVALLTSNPTLAHGRAAPRRDIAGDPPAGGWAAWGRVGYSPGRVAGGPRATRVRSGRRPCAKRTGHKEKEQPNLDEVMDGSGGVGRRRPPTAADAAARWGCPPLRTPPPPPPPARWLRRPGRR